MATQALHQIPPRPQNCSRRRKGAKNALVPPRELPSWAAMFDLDQSGRQRRPLPLTAPSNDSEPDSDRLWPSTGDEYRLADTVFTTGSDSWRSDEGALLPQKGRLADASSSRRTMPVRRGMRYLKSAMAGLIAALVVAVLYLVLIAIEREVTFVERELTSDIDPIRGGAVSVVRDVNVWPVLWLAIPAFAAGFFWRLRRNSATAK